MIRSLLRWLHWHTKTPVERVEPRWREVRRREIERCLARFEDR